MRKVLRHEDNQDHWDRRWADAERDADGFSDLNIYPIKYAQLVMDNPADCAVDLGAGLGRILKHYYNLGHNIVGLERSEVAVQKLKSEIPNSRIFAGDVQKLPFEDAQFDVISAFGLYHNLENELKQALLETARILKPGGRFCISVHPDNLEMRINEWYWKWKQRRHPKSPLKFHKWLLGKQEFIRTLSQYQLNTQKVYFARNVSLLYRIPLLCSSSKNETERRTKGYRLNIIGRILDRILVTLFPSQFCNALVFIGTKGT